MHNKPCKREHLNCRDNEDCNIFQKRNNLLGRHTMTSRHLKLLVTITSGVLALPGALAFKSSELFPTRRSWQRLRGQDDRRHDLLRTTGLCSTNKERNNGIRRNRNGKTGTTSHGGFSAQTEPMAVPPTTIRIRALRQLCNTPLIFSIDDFVTAETCAELLQNDDQERAEEARLQFASLGVRRSDGRR